MPEEDNGSEPTAWTLAAQFPPDQPGEAHGIEFIRTLTADELGAVRDANALLNRLGGARAYATVAELMQAVLMLVDQVANDTAATTATAQTDQQARTTVGNLVHALDSLSAELSADVSETFGADSDEATAFARVSERETARAPFQVALGLGASADKLQLDSASSGEAAGRRLVVEESLIGAYRESGEVEWPEPVLAVPLLMVAVQLAQRIEAEYLLLHEDRIEEESRLLKDLAAEVFEGAAILVGHGLKDDKPDITNMRIEPLALERIPLLHQAIRRARQFLAEGGDPERILHVDAQDEPTSPLDISESAGAADQSINEEQPAEDQPTGDRRAAVVDMDFLLRKLMRASERYERAWSAALDPDALGAAHKQLSAEWSSLATAFQRNIKGSDSELRKAGLDPRLPTYPLDVDALAELSFEPNQEQHWRQLQVAELYAFQATLVALRGLSDPSYREVDRATGKESASWWDSGAFHRVRARAGLLQRVAQARENAENNMLAAVGSSELAGGEVPIRTWEAYRTLAANALDQGDVEATLLHASLALRSRVADVVGISVVSLPPDLIDRLCSQPELDEVAPALHLLEEARGRLGRGVPLDLGASIPIAEPILDLVSAMCTSPPIEAFRSAVATGADE